MRLMTGMLGLVWAYYEAGETDEAFEALSRRTHALAAVAIARLGQGREAIDDLILMPVRTRVQLMYGAGTAGRLIVAFERGCGRTG